MYLIVNLGLKSIRVIVFDRNGSQVFSDSKPVHTFILNNYIEQDANEWLERLDELLIDLKETTRLITAIEHVTVTTSSSCILGVDRNFNPKTKVIMVSDKRSSEQVELIKKFDGTNKEFSPISTSYTIPKVLWFKEHLSNFDEVKFWVGSGEFLNYFFTQKIFTDPLNASKSLYKEGSGYRKDLFGKLGLSVKSFPEVKPIGHTVDISEKIKKNYGFKKNCLFTLTTYDAVCSVLGSYNSLENNACDVSGTVTSVRMLIDKNKIKNIKNKSPYLIVQKIDLIDKVIIGASNNMGGGIIEWLKQAFYDENDSDVYYRIENDAIKSGLGSNGILFLPYLLGERAPFNSTNIRAEFIGINRSSRHYDFTRAAFEATAFVTNDLLLLIKDLNPKSLSVSGGLARFDLINQIKADVTGLPVYVLGNFESTSLGALILCILANDKSLTYQEIAKDIVQIRKVIYPNRKNQDIYKQYFEYFTEHRNLVKDSYNEHEKVYKMIDSFRKKNIRNL